MNLGFIIALIAVWAIPVVLIFRMVRLAIKIYHAERNNEGRIIGGYAGEIPNEPRHDPDPLGWNRRLRDLELYVFIVDGKAYDNDLLSPLFVSWKAYTKLDN